MDNSPYINQAGLKLIESYEGLRLNAYQDQVGVWTIGYGHTGDVHQGMTITAEQANQFLSDDLARFAVGVHSLVKVHINENQSAALISFSYNLGLHALSESTLLKFVNVGEFQQAADEFPKWDRAGHVESTGLHRRRIAERALFLTPGT